MGTVNGKMPGFSIAAAVLFMLSAAGGAYAFPGGSSSPGGEDGGFGSSVSGQVLRYVSNLYIEPERSRPLGLIESAFSHLETHYPEILATFDEKEGTASVQVDRESRTFDLPGGDSLAATAVFLDAVADFAAPLLDPPLESGKLRQETLRGALRSLDPHTRLFTPDEVEKFAVETKGKFGGVGFTMGPGPESITVLGVLPRTPAERIGLMEGDRITLVDGVPTGGMSVSEAVRHVRGEPGTEVTLTVERGGWEGPRELTAKREIIKLPSVESRLLEEGDSTVLYLRLNRFQEDSGAQIREALYAAGEEAPAGIILDLRNNPGGLLDQAVSIADLFLDEGVIVSTRNRRGISSVKRANAFGLVREQEPLVVLINRGSASAAEVVSAALKGSRALVIGETSFGKGSVQQFYPLADGGGLLLTIAHYLTPGEVSIQSVGVEPDILLSPVVVGERIQVTPREGHRSEASLENAFSAEEEAGRQGGGASVMEFFREGGGGPALSTSIGHPDLPGEEGDFAIRLAARILAASGKGGAGKTGLSAAAAPVLEKISREEHVKIEEAFSDRDITWSSPSDPPPGGKIVGALKEDVVFEAGDTASLSLWVENSGNSPLYRLWGRTRSGNPSLTDLDFAFGTLAPGERRSLSVDVDVPLNSEGRWDPLEVHFQSAGGPETDVVTGGIRIAALPRPDLAYSYSVEDGKPGDGIVDGGDGVTIEVTVTNRGMVPLADLQVKAFPGGGAELRFEKRSLEIGALDEGATGKGSFSFRVPEDAIGETVDFALQFYADEYGMLLSDRISLPLGAPYVTSGNRFPPRFVIEPVVMKTGKGTLLLEIVAEDDEVLKDLYVYRGKKKVYYGRNRQETPRFSSTLEITLEEGLNKILLFSRDQNESLARRTIYVFRADPPAE